MPSEQQTPFGDFLGILGDHHRNHRAPGPRIHPLVYLGTHSPGLRLQCAQRVHRHRQCIGSSRNMLGDISPNSFATSFDPDELRCSPHPRVHCIIDDNPFFVLWLFDCAPVYHPALDANIQPCRFSAPLFPQDAILGREAAYWIHLGLVLAFLNYLPLSKHIHLLGALPNIFFRNLSDRRLDLPKLDLEDETQWGVGDYQQFSWKSLVDTYACTECARCTNYCPAYATDKNLSPMQLVHDIRYEMIDRDALQAQREQLLRQIEPYESPESSEQSVHPDLAHLQTQLTAIDQQLNHMQPLVGGRIQEDTLWACTTCGACQEVCPVFIEHPLKIIQMRQNLVLEQEKTPAELGRTFRNLERQQNPWGISNENRMAWAEGLEVPTVQDNPNPEYILWVGCAGAFDRRIIKQTRAMIQILQAAQVDYAVLGHQESCTGDPARRAGNELLFQMQAEKNVEILNQVGARKVIASCPHCLHTLRQDYPQFGGNYQVIHHTQLIDHLFQSGKLRTDKSDLESVTYHDSCYLGRWNGEYEAPRAILRSVGATTKELPRSKQHGFCCGAGGGRMFMEEEAPRINTNRTQEIIELGTKTVAVACPFCNIMLTDGMKSCNKEDDVQVLDVAELVAKVLH